MFLAVFATIWIPTASSGAPWKDVFELVGEAATCLPVDWRARHSQIPWREIIAMRNVMIHGYDVVMPEVLWNVATSDVPKLREAIQTIVEKGNG